MDKSRAEIAHVLPDDVRRFLAQLPQLTSDFSFNGPNWARGSLLSSSV